MVAFTLGQPEQKSSSKSRVTGHLTLIMVCAKVVITNSSSQDHTQSDDCGSPSYDMIPGFNPFKTQVFIELERSYPSCKNSPKLLLFCVLQTNI